MVDSLPLAKYYYIHPKYSWFRLASMLPIPIASVYLLSFNAKPYSIKRNFSPLTPSLINYEFTASIITRNKSLSSHHNSVDNEKKCSPPPIITSKKFINNTETCKILLLEIGPLVKGTN